MYKIIAIFIGGGIGALSRFAVFAFSERIYVGSFPIGTFIVNIIGSFLLGLLWQVFASKLNLQPEMKAMILVGFLGAFTTFSTYSLDTINLLQNSKYLLSISNFILMNGIAMVAVYLGIVLGHRIAPV